MTIERRLEIIRGLGSMMIETQYDKLFRFHWDFRLYEHKERALTNANIIWKEILRAYEYNVLNELFGTDYQIETYVKPLIEEILLAKHKAVLDDDEN